SVMLTMQGAQRLDKEGVQAILNLVAAAVPGLHPRNIALVDSRGDLLARAGEPVTPASGALSAEELRRTTELRLSRAVEEMLERSLGPGRVRAEAAVRMDFDRVNETQERYDPDGQVPRSTQSINSSSKSKEQTGTVSVQNNLPNADAGNQGAGTQEARQEETTNYEISKTVRTLIREEPRIDRISLAVMVDGVETTGKDGKRAWQSRSADEIARITTLVKGAIGFDEKRGDRVTVVSMRFQQEDEPAPASSGLLGVRFDKADYMRLAETALFGLIGLIGLLTVLRPMVMRLTALAPADGIGLPQAALAGGALPALPAPGSTSGAGPSLPAPGSPAALSAARVGGLIEDESMVDVAQIEGQMRASSLRKVANLVDKHPNETLNIMRGWMARENG